MSPAHHRHLTPKRFYSTLNPREKITAFDVTIGDIQEKSLTDETRSVTAEQETEKATTEVDVKSSTSEESATGHCEFVQLRCCQLKVRPKKAVTTWTQIGIQTSIQFFKGGNPRKTRSSLSFLKKQYSNLLYLAHQKLFDY